MGSETTVEKESPLGIAFRIAEEDGRIDKLLVLAVRKDGTSFSIDNGLTAEEGKRLAMDFHSWLDQCLGREMERGK